MFRREWLALAVGVWSATAPGTDARLAVVDRVVGDRAVLVFEDPPRRRVVPVDRLPEDARSEGAVLRVRLDGNEVIAASRVPDATARRERERAARFDALATDA